MDDIVLLRGESDITITPCTYIPSTLQVCINDQTVTAYDGSLALHGSCLSIVQRVIEANTKYEEPSPTRLTSLADFVKLVLERRKLNEAAWDRMMGKVASSEMMASAWNARGGVEWDHEYFGGRRFWGMDGWEEELGYEWLVTDPSTLDATPYLLSHLSPCKNSPLLNLPPHEESLSPAALELLPEPALASIIEHLSLPSILRLRRCSKILFERIRLGQWFFRRRLLEGTLAPYLPSIPQTSPLTRYGVEWDWKALARLMIEEEGTFEDKQVPRGLRNRKRIWNMINLM